MLNKYLTNLFKGGAGVPACGLHRRPASASYRTSALAAVLIFCAISSLSGRAGAQISSKSIETIERAMTDELARAKAELKLKGLVDPFFISYTVTDETKLEIQASNGALQSSSEDHSRAENARLLINNYQLDDENFSDNSSMFGGGGSAPDQTLPLDDDYIGIRRTLWLTTDDLFKSSNETFTKKKAALEQKRLSDDVKDLPDFAKATTVEVIIEPRAMPYDRAALELLAKELSAVFVKYSEIIGSSVSLKLTNDYEIIRNTEGSHVRQPLTLCILKVSAFAQSTEEGDPLSLSFAYSEATPEHWPNRDSLLKQTKQLAESLKKLVHAPRFSEKSYTGPVLFEGSAARDFLLTNIISRIGAHREDVLGGADIASLLGGMHAASLKDRLNTRILPGSVSVIDDPSQTSTAMPIGHYAADDEAVAPTTPLTLIDHGILKTLYMNRTPTKEVRETNGHARTTNASPLGMGASEPGPGIVTVFDSNAIAASQLHNDLMKRAKEDGYDYALVVRSLGSITDFLGGIESNFSDILSRLKNLQPLLIYKIYPDGREELLRGAEITYPTTRDLREIITSKEIATYNVLAPASGGLFSFSSTIPATLIGPTAILSPELEVQRYPMKATPTKPVVERPTN